MARLSPPAQAGYPPTLNTDASTVLPRTGSLELVRSGRVFVGSLGWHHLCDKTEHCPESRSGFLPMLRHGRRGGFTSDVRSGRIQHSASRRNGNLDEIWTLGPRRLATLHYAKIFGSPSSAQDWPAASLYTDTLDPLSRSPLRDDGLDPHAQTSRSTQPPPSAAEHTHGRKDGRISEKTIFEHPHPTI